MEMPTSESSITLRSDGELLTPVRMQLHPQNPLSAFRADPDDASRYRSRRRVPVGPFFMLVRTHSDLLNTQASTDALDHPPRHQESQRLDHFSRQCEDHRFRLSEGQERSEIVGGDG